MPDYFIGIDPGIHGAIALCNPDGGGRLAWVMPTQATGKGNRRALDAVKVHDYLLSQGEPFCIIERQQAFPKQGGISNFTTGYGYGVLTAALDIAGISYQAVTPRTWKKAFGIVGTGRAGKKAALVVARRLWPKEPVLFRLYGPNPHDGIVDAMLIAEYARRVQVVERRVAATGDSGVVGPATKEGGTR